MVYIIDTHATVQQDDRCVLFPLESNALNFIPVELDIHDGIICGTALVYQKVLKERAIVITKDEEIVKSRIVETVW